MSKYANIRGFKFQMSQSEQYWGPDAPSYLGVWALRLSALTSCWYVSLQCKGTWALRVTKVSCSGLYPRVVPLGFGILLSNPPRLRWLIQGLHSGHSAEACEGYDLKGNNPCNP